MNTPRTSTREHWSPGDVAHFDYSLDDDANSEIAKRLFHRTGQQVEVLGEAEHDGTEPTFAERVEAGALIAYRVRFPDGHEDVAFEDELLEPMRVKVTGNHGYHYAPTGSVGTLLETPRPTDYAVAVLLDGPLTSTAGHEHPAGLTQIIPLDDLEEIL